MFQLEIWTIFTSPCDWSMTNKTQQCMDAKSQNSTYAYAEQIRFNNRSTAHIHSSKQSMNASLSKKQNLECMQRHHPPWRLQSGPKRTAG